MKLTKLILTSLPIIAAGLLSTACSSNDEPSGEDSKIELPAARMFILNEGSNTLNNAGISFYNPDGGEPTFIDDIFYLQNDMRLGDSGEDMLRSDNEIFVSVYGSNYLTKLNAACVETDRHLFSGDPMLQGGIRYIAAKDGYIYASFHGGIVAKINAKSLTVENTISNLGANLEGVAIAGDCLYVANSYLHSLDPATGYDTYQYFKDIFVIDLKSFSLKETLEVAQNPNDLLEANGKVFVISWDYYDQSYPLQMIDPADGNKVTTLGYATQMGAGNGILYLADSRSDYSNYPQVTTHTTFSSYNIKTGKFNSESFLKNAPKELETSSIYMITTDPSSHDIYIATTDYATSGEIYRFADDGTFITKFSSGGINPRKAVFF